MKKYLQQKLNNEKGMTLIELLAVIVIIAIIAAIAIPAIGNIIENSRLSAVKSDATNVMSAANIYFAETSGEDTVDAKTLVDDGFLDNAGKLSVAVDETVIENVNPINITTKTPIEFSGNKTVTFSKATVEGITGNDTKGSAVDEDGLTLTATP